MTIDLQEMRHSMSTWGVPTDLLQPDTTIAALVGAAGEPALTHLIMLLEQRLSEPFPVSLLASVGTLGELLEFTEIKQSWEIATKGES